MEDSRTALMKAVFDYRIRKILTIAMCAFFGVSLIYFLAQPAFIDEPEDYLINFDRLMVLATFLLGSALAFAFGGQNKANAQSAADAEGS